LGARRHPRCIKKARHLGRAYRCSARSWCARHQEGGGEQRRVAGGAAEDEQGERAYRQVARALHARAQAPCRVRPVPSAFGTQC
jgi:hypothetical protein